MGNMNNKKRSHGQNFRPIQIFHKKKLIIGSLFVFLAISFLLDNLAFEIVDSIKNPIIDYLLENTTHLSSIIFILIVITSLFLWSERKKKWIPVLWSSFVFTGLIGYIFKFGFARARPLAVYFIPLLGWIDYSFPSMHTAICFSLVPVLDKEFPKLKWVWILFAIAVGFSRVYLKMHYLSDVIAGALLGMIIGYLFIKFEINTVD